MSRALSVRARFERFPATVKGAFILRGEDADPHQVEFRDVRAVALSGGARREVPVAATVLDVAPHRDVFVPFELMVFDLEPGWYAFECELEVDGVLGTYPGGRRFVVPWPRGSVRRGSIPVERVVPLGRQSSVRVEQLDCAGDSMRLTLRVEPPAPVRVRLAADGKRLEVLEEDVDEAHGRVRVTAYPLLRSHGVLAIEIRGRGRDAALVEVPLA